MENLPQVETVVKKKTDVPCLNRTALQVLIDNWDDWELEYRKGGLEYLIGEANEKTTL